MLLQAFRSYLLSSDMFNFSSIFASEEKPLLQSHESFKMNRPDPLPTVFTAYIFESIEDIESNFW